MVAEMLCMSLAWRPIHTTVDAAKQESKQYLSILFYFFHLQCNSPQKKKNRNIKIVKINTYTLS